MQIEVYRGSCLAASFDYRDDGLHLATFYGAAGQAVRARISGRPASAAWQSADGLRAALAAADFRVVLRGPPDGHAAEPPRG